jgi:hypothetical protein
MDLYCGNCGKKNDPSAKFCESCGKSLSPIQPPIPRPVPPKRRSWISRTASIGAFITIAFFFLPWVSVSCSASSLTMSATTVSGYQIASGHIPLLDNLSSLGTYFGGLGTGMDSSGVSNLVKNELNNQTSFPVVWLILGIGVIGLLSLVGGKKGGRIALGIGIVGVIALVILGIKISEINSQISTYGFEVGTESGLVFEWLGFLFMTGMGILSLIYDSN